MGGGAARPGVRRRRGGGEGGAEGGAARPCGGEGGGDWGGRGPSGHEEEGRGWGWEGGGGEARPGRTGKEGAGPAGLEGSTARPGTRTRRGGWVGGCWAISLRPVRDATMAAAVTAHAGGRARMRALDCARSERACAHWIVRARSRGRGVRRWQGLSLTSGSTGSKRSWSCHRSGCASSWCCLVPALHHAACHDVCHPDRNKRMDTFYH